MKGFNTNIEKSTLEKTKAKTAKLNAEADPFDESMHLVFMDRLD
jgi:hypothetical protein